MWDPGNLFLNGPYAPWRQNGEAFDLEVEGRIPDGLDGALYRTSASQAYRPSEPNRHHWFDGDGAINGIFLRDGRATHRFRYVETAGLKLEMQQGRAAFSSFMNGRSGPAPQSALPFKNPANTNVSLFDDRLLVFCEADVPHELRPDTLHTVNQRYDFGGAVAGPVTAHFKIDPASGDMLFYGALGSSVTWYRADRHGKVMDRHSFDMGTSSFVHDYAVTQDYAVFLVSPALVDFEAVLAGRPATVWSPDVLPVSRWALLHRATGKVTWVDAGDAFMPTHYLNAYQENGTVVVDAQRASSFGMTRDELEAGPPGGDWNWWFTRMVATTCRWEIDPARGTVTETQVNDVLGEFPKINEELTGHKHRYGYYATTRGAGDWFTDGIAKHDYLTGGTQVQTMGGELTSPSEPQFVPRETSTAEDDGWLLSIWWDPATDRSELVIQDAADVSAAPVARVKLTHRVPMGFHGSWSSAAELDAALRAEA
jgi:carotenoid cleavage dioxygenase-like enzyme